jgi:hypothetical protein
MTARLADAKAGVELSGGDQPKASTQGKEKQNRDPAQERFEACAENEGKGYPLRSTSPNM